MADLTKLNAALPVAVTAMKDASTAMVDSSKAMGDAVTFLKTLTPTDPAQQAQIDAVADGLTTAAAPLEAAAGPLEAGAQALETALGAQAPPTPIPVPTPISTGLVGGPGSTAPAPSKLR